MGSKTRYISIWVQALHRIAQIEGLLIIRIDILILAAAGKLGWFCIFLQYYTQFLIERSILIVRKERILNANDHKNHNWHRIFSLLRPIEKACICIANCNPVAAEDIKTSRSNTALYTCASVSPWPVSPNAAYKATCVCICARVMQIQRSCKELERNSQCLILRQPTLAVLVAPLSSSPMLYGYARPDYVWVCPMRVWVCIWMPAFMAMIYGIGFSAIYIACTGKNGFIALCAHIAKRCGPEKQRSRNSSSSSTQYTRVNNKCLLTQHIV